PAVVTTTVVTIRINTGSTTRYTDTKGNGWAGDAYYTNALAGALPATGMMDFGPIAIANTTDPQIFQTEHYCMSSYNIPVTNGTYTVNLDFAENYFTGGPGQRVFNVNVAGQSLTNVDIYALVRPNASLSKTFNNLPF